MADFDYGSVAILFILFVLYIIDYIFVQNYAFKCSGKEACCQ